jgi:hypothetical protein
LWWGGGAELILVTLVAPPDKETLESE